MPVIRISQQTWERLKKHATPLVHTANDVVEMALEALDAQGTKHGTAFHAGRSAVAAKKNSNRSKAEATPLPLKQLRAPLLEALFDKAAKRTAGTFARPWSRRWRLCSLMPITNWSRMVSLAGGIRCVRCATS